MAIGNGYHTTEKKKKRKEKLKKKKEEEEGGRKGKWGRKGYISNMYYIPREHCPTCIIKYVLYKIVGNWHIKKEYLEPHPMFTLISLNTSSLSKFGSRFQVWDSRGGGIKDYVI